MEANEARASLRALGRRRAGLLRRLADVDAQLETAILTADGLGVPRLTIGKDAGVARATVYNVLGRDERQRETLAALADELAQ